MQNNLKIIKKHKAPIYIRALFKAGSRYDTIPGTAHFLEHMLVAGTKNYPTKDALATYIENVGGSFSASTNADLIRINVEVAQKEDIQIAANVLSEIINNTSFDPKVFEKERGSILAEFEKKKSNPGEFVWEVWRRLFFQETDLSQSTLGSIETIKSISLADVQDFKNIYLIPNNFSLLSCGDIDSQTLHSALTSKKIQISEFANRGILPEQPIVRKHITDIEICPGEQVNFIFGCRTSVPSLHTRAALDLMLTHLVGGRASKLISELRYKRGLVYSISGSYLVGQDWASWQVASSCRAKDLSEILQIIILEINSLQTIKITSEKLYFLQSKITKSALIRLQTSRAVVDASEAGFTFSLDTYSIEDYLKAVQSLTIDDIQKIAQEYIKTDLFYYAMCGPESLKDLRF